jgi:carbon monoxide dehydrogenase subunit G
MADLKISQLPAATTPLAGTEVLPIVQSGTTKQVSIDNLTAGKAVSASTVSATTVTATTVQGSLDTNVTAAKVTVSGTSITASGTDTNINVTVTPKGTGTVVSGSTFTDTYGKVRAIPQSGSAKTTSYTLTTADVGRFIEIGTSGSIVIPDATFSAGDSLVLFNNTTGSITVTCTITTAYKAGTDADQATVTLTTRGLATILFISGTVCVISGNLA